MKLYKIKAILRATFGSETWIVRIRKAETVSCSGRINEYRLATQCRDEGELKCF